MPVAFTGCIDEESHALGDGEVVMGCPDHVGGKVLCVSIKFYDHGAIGDVLAQCFRGPGVFQGDGDEVPFLVEV